MADADVPEAARSNVTAIAAGWGFSLALRSDGQVVVWVDPAFEQSLAHCNLTAPPSEATAGSEAAAVHVVQLAAGMTHAVALLSDGRVLSWGCDLSGQVPAPLLPARAVAISSG
jgi:hypothetical protein